MNVILDIDETFVQYVGHEDWATLPPAEQAKYETGGSGPNGLFILRPKFTEFFQFLTKNCKSISLWTWSDADYAMIVKKMIEQKVPGTKIANVWSEKDVDASIEMSGKNKDLNYIWYDVGKFQPCDTILVDDLPKNTQNTSNVKNGIQIAPFHPLGEKLRQGPKKIRTNIYHDLSNDNVLMEVADKIKEAQDASDFCEEGDLPHPFPKPVIIGMSGGKRRKTRRHNPKRKTRRNRGL